MKSSELAKILMRYPDADVVVRIFDDDFDFDVLDTDEIVILLVEPDTESDDIPDTRMFA